MSCARHVVESLLDDESPDPNGKYRENRSWFVNNGERYTVNRILNAVRDTPEQWMPLSRFEWMLGGIGDPGWEEFVGWNVERIKRADLNFPVIVFQSDPGEKWDVADGAHRLAKAKLEGRTQIKVKVLPADFFDDYKKRYRAPVDYDERLKRMRERRGESRQ